MNDINNIDELLKNSFNQFEATPPADAWSNVQQGMQNAGSHLAKSSGVKSAATAVKSTALFTKIALVSSVSAVLIGGGIIAYNTLIKNNETAKSAQQTVISIPQTKTETNTIVEEQKNLQVPIENKLEKNNKVTPKQSKSAVNNASEIKIENNSAQQKTEPVISEKQPQHDIENKPLVKTQNPPAPIQNNIKPKPKHQFSNDEKASSVSSQSSAESAVEKPFIPNAFTPNNDGNNDRFKVKIENETFYEMKIMDRNGNTVFESNNKDITWDGTKLNSGEACTEGDYIYILKYQFKNIEKIFTVKDHVSLIR